MVGIGFPLCFVSDGSGYRFSNIRLPTGEHIAVPLGRARKCGNAEARQQTVVYLIGENGFFLHAIGVDDRIGIFVLVSNAVVVGVDFP